jgi:4-hydroxybenzoate polyprenyltransferase
VRFLLVVILLIVGAAAIVAGVLYLTQPVHSLPTFFPGYAAHSLGKAKKHGYAGIAAGAVLVIIALVVGMTGSRSRRSSR